MSYNHWLSQGFALVFFAIIMPGVFLSFSTKLALISLIAAFGMNLCLYVVCLYKALTGELVQDFDVHL